MDIFCKNEEKVADLYYVYADLFVTHSDLWSMISAQEREHSRLFRGLSLIDEEDASSFKINRHSMGILNYISRFIDDQLSIARSGKIDAACALETALRLEQSMIEKKCFEMFEPRSEEIYEAFRRVNHETGQHRDRFQKELKKLIAKK